MLALLTTPGVSDEERDRKAAEALHAAAASGQNGAIADLVASLRVPIGAPDGDGCTALHQAALHNHLNTAQYLVKELGAAVDVRNAEGDTPPSCSVSRGPCRNGPHASRRIGGICRYNK